MSQEERLLKIRWANALRGERKKQRLTRGELANMIGLTDASIDHYEAARSFPCRETYQQLCDLFPSLRELPTPTIRTYSTKPGRPAQAVGVEPHVPAHVPATLPPTSPEKEPDNSAVLTLSLMVQAGCTAQQVADVAAKLIERAERVGR